MSSKFDHSLKDKRQTRVVFWLDQTASRTIPIGLEHDPNLFIKEKLFYCLCWVIAHFSMKNIFIW